MRSMILLLALSLPAFGQSSTARNPNYGANKMAGGATLPATCTESQLYFKTSATKGVYQCVGGSWRRLVDADTSGSVQIGNTALSPTYGFQGPGAASSGFRGLMAALDSGQTAALQVIGDSTGNETSEWVYLATQWLAARYPNQRVLYSAWNGTRYPAWTVVQAAAGERAIRFTGSGNEYVQPAAAISGFTGDLDVRIKVKPTSWRPGAIQVLVSREAGAGKRVFWMTLNTAGTLSLVWSADGTNLHPTKTSTVAIADTQTDPLWVRATLDVDNGAGGNDVKFWTSADGVTWVQLGATVTTASATSLFNDAPALAAVSWGIGARGGGTGPYSGDIYECHIATTIDGVPAHEMQIDSWQPAAVSTATFVGSPTLRVVNGSHAGADLTYFTANLNAMAPDYGQVAAILSTSHNEGLLYSKVKMNEYSTYITALKGRLPSATPILLTQNPVISPATYGVAQATRRARLIGLGSQLGYPVIDTYAAFPTDPTAYLNVDGIHPNATGQAAWAGLIEAKMASESW